jgi:hypothetical protein
LKFEAYGLDVEDWNLEDIEGQLEKTQLILNKQFFCNGLLLTSAVSNECPFAVKLKKLFSGVKIAQAGPKIASYTIPQEVSWRSCIV